MLKMLQKEVLLLILSNEKRTFFSEFFLIFYQNYEPKVETFLKENKFEDHYFMLRIQINFSCCYKT
ncbi:hypothetical protein HYN56_05730 [Flavobacterium crocinum]|uniref:Uncharacterized protein n=1 Tax=Flavobacterium crocinum TaxID=2183896 RepID=A0A2S1YI69_9FLAO|nr:hypothetical protein HYN56_05730 [Flavobacterium crocinum]